ncbi:tetratricopeptide repeat protein [Kaistella rhinocerotis]|uniref:tetratricopeptide repeat protein n=1 Tax=Kaistella rhinocerotis TaxID=3026437 RepID=UPI002555E013|nr:hypothetical protein [Kaistella sp. Ran72]
MNILHKITPFLYQLFNVTYGDKVKLIADITEYYTINQHLPVVKEKEGIISVDIPVKLYLDTVSYTHLISLCENKQFEKAYPVAVDLVSRTPSNSELNRIKGQIESELGETDKAVDSLIDALRWDPKNTYALIMMGNIFARDKNDIETAMKYFNQASVADPEDNISLNNIGANLMIMGRLDEAQEFFEKAEKLNNKYPNTKYGLAYVSFSKENYENAFQYVLQSLTLNKVKDGLFGQSIDLAKAIAEKVDASDDAAIALKSYAEKLELLTGKKIQIQEDTEIPTVAKVELAENHNRDYHLIKYKPGYPGVTHLVLHELTHIELAEEARIAGNHMLFTATHQHRIKFMTDYENYAKFLQKKGYPETSIAGVMNSLFEGLNRQVYNTPIDLFIEDRLYNDFPELRPVQFVSLYTLMMEGLDAVTRKEIVDLTDTKILSNSKIYNIVNALHFKELFSFDAIKLFKPSTLESRQATSLYKEYGDYRSDKEPGEEYELLQNWANDLSLSKYFQLVLESEYKKTAIDLDIPELKDIDENTEADQKIEMHEFQEKHQDANLNPAVMMFMVGALKYFKDKSSAEIKRTAFEIATIGVNGINPDKQDGYRVNSIPGSNFSGYQLLAYYYVSFALSAPQLLPELQLPFDREFESAKEFVKP